MKLYLVNKTKPQHGFEVVKYDPDRSKAILRSMDGTFHLDRNFHIKVIRRFYDLVQEPPEWLKEKGNAVVT